MYVKQIAAIMTLTCGVDAARAVVTPDPLFSDYAVLQRDRPIPVWGTAAAGEELTVSFAGQVRTTRAGADGKWMAKLDPMPASAEPRELRIGGFVARNVLVGEVWVGAGQSNMAGNSGGYEKADAGLAQLIEGGTRPLLRLTRAGAKWQEASPEAARRFSALLFSFGAPLQKELGVPVGLLVGAVGGTPSGYWLSREAYEADDGCRTRIAAYAQSYDFDQALRKYDADMDRWTKADAAAKAKDGKGAPGQPQKPLKAGECRGAIGHLYERHIRPFLPFAIRGVLWDQGESRTGIQGLDQYTLMGALIRGWRREWGQGDFPFLHVQKPSGGGPAWDPSDPVTCRANAFAAPPAQVPPFSTYRDGHIRMASLPNSFIVTASDLGEGIHPPNKSGYGARACRVALGAVYGKPVAFCGPIYTSCEFKDGRAILRFTHVGQGLAFRHGEKLQGFAVAGEDGRFVWGEARIDGDAVVVSSDKVPGIKAVRYACSDKFPWANLFNKDGLPALSFHTDEVPLAP